MANKERFRPRLISACENVVDEALSTDGYARTQLTYKRPSGRAPFQQRIDLGVQWSPPSNPEALALLVPRLQVIAPAVSPVLVEMMGNARTWGPEVPLVNSPIGWMSDDQLGTWYVLAENDFDEVVSDFVDFYRSHVRTAAESVASLDDLVAAGERRDKRFLPTRQCGLRAAAAAVVLGEAARGARILRTYFPSEGARRDYRAAFEFVESKLDSD